MDINNLTEEQAIELLNTDFGEDLEKTAEAIVEAEEYVEYGQQLALEKIAAMEAAYEQGDAEVGYDQEKLASADVISEYIQQGFVDTMMKMGAANYGDELIYLEEMAKEAGKIDEAMKMLKKLPGKASEQGRKAYRMAREGKDFVVRNAKKGSGYNDIKAALLKNKQMGAGGVDVENFRKLRNSYALKGGAKALATGGLLGGAAYGVNKYKK